VRRGRRSPPVSEWGPVSGQGERWPQLRQDVEASRDAYVAARDVVFHSNPAEWCTCGLKPTGACCVCGFPACDRHGALLDDVFLCGTHWHERKQENEAAMAWAAAERERDRQARVAAEAARREARRAAAAKVEVKRRAHEVKVKTNAAKYPKPQQFYMVELGKINAELEMIDRKLERKLAPSRFSAPLHVTLFLGKILAKSRKSTLSSKKAVLLPALGCGSDCEFRCRFIPHRYRPRVSPL
jgi:hypothetical protein